MIFPEWETDSNEPIDRGVLVVCQGMCLSLPALRQLLPSVCFAWVSCPQTKFFVQRNFVGRRLVSEPGFVSFRNLDSSRFGLWIRLVSERG